MCAVYDVISAVHLCVWLPLDVGKRNMGSQWEIILPRDPSEETGYIKGRAGSWKSEAFTASWMLRME